MVLKRFEGPRGRIERVPHTSEVLVGNPLGDPVERELALYLPAVYDEDPERRFPTLFALAGYTGSGLGMIGWRNFTESLPERLDRLIHEAKMGPAIVVFPDCFTALGGNQYVNSSAIGSYADYLVRELVPFVDAGYRTLADRDHRGVFGKSSGGYGALLHGMRYPECWGAVACHSGDLYFEYAYRSDLSLLIDVLATHERSVERFLDAFHAQRKPSGREIHALMLVAMAASYDPDPDAPLGFHLPVDPYTAEIDPVRWSMWLRWDPVELVEECAGNLARLRLLYFDCGTRDQYRLHYGARILHERLERRRIEHVHEEFDDDHSGIEYRLEVSLPKLSRALR